MQIDRSRRSTYTDTYDGILRALEMDKRDLDPFSPCDLGRRKLDSIVKGCDGR